MAIQPLRISIVIPVYNEQDTIAACLDSVLAQRSAVDEIVVVNNRSTDRTSEILDRYAGRVVVLQELRQGVLYARNAGSTPRPET
jgi:glycosyltransferase involved in cell wall biosynthesis